MQLLDFQTGDTRQVIGITSDVNKALSIEAGTVSLQVLHTTAAITTADLDPGTDQDMLESFWGMIPEPTGGFRHPHDPKHAPAHLLASLIGPSITLVIADGKLQLGTWQQVVLVEFDGPRHRTVALTQQAILT